MPSITPTLQPKFSGDSWLQKLQKAGIQNNYPHASKDDIDFVASQMNNALKKGAKITGLATALGLGMGYLIDQTRKQKTTFHRLKSPIKTYTLFGAIIGFFIGEIISTPMSIKKLRDIFRQKPHLVTENPLYKNLPITKTLASFAFPKELR